MTNGKIKIVLVDDHQLVRQTWKLLLEQEDSFQIIGECSNGEEAISAAANLNPDVMLMDINMGPVNGFEATRKIVTQFPAIKIIGLSINNQPTYARNLIQLGASGYVTKNSTRAEMVEAIREVFDGNNYICREVKDRMKGGAP